MSKFICSVCGYVYDEINGDSSLGVEPLDFKSLDKSWKCPVCGVLKSRFERHDY